MSASRNKNSTSGELAGAQLEAYKRFDDRLMITIKVSDEQYVAIVLKGVLSVIDRGWQSIVRLTTVIDGTPVRLADLESRCRRASEIGLPFTFQLPADDGGSGLEVVAREISVERDTVESFDGLPKSVF